MRNRKGPLVDTGAGRLRGVWQDDGAVAVFRGVPFAAPPVGDRRWRPPAPAEPWTGIRSASRDAPWPIQRGATIQTFFDELVRGQGWSRARTAAVKTLVDRAPKPRQSEDCLYLTVRTPQLDPAARLPVMVWIHGGDHQDGAASEPFYASNALPRHGVVTVSISYRLGLLGYLAHPELAAESDDGVSGNYGTLDQIAALRWVRDNIGSFGGDPDQVTIFGESAGGESVLHLMTSPLARGLFQRAIAQSPANGGQMIHLREPFLDRDAAEDTGVAFADALGLTGDHQIERLRRRSADELYALVRAAGRLGDHYPVIDGHVLPESPLAAFAGGRQAQVPLIIGSNADEGTLIHPAFGGVPMHDFRHRPVPTDALQPEMRDAFGDDLDRLAALYPGLDRRDRGAEIRFLGDLMFGAPVHWYARHHAASGAPTWVYLFARTPPSPKQTAGAFHAAEVPFVHGSSVPILPLTDDDRTLASAMQQRWTSFASTGDPGGSGATGDPGSTGGHAWPGFDPDAPEWLVLDHTIRAEPIARLEAYEIMGARLARLVEAMAQLSPVARPG